MIVEIIQEAIDVELDLGQKERIRSGLHLEVRNHLAQYSEIGEDLDELFDAVDLSSENAGYAVKLISTRDEFGAVYTIVGFESPKLDRFLQMARGGEPKVVDGKYEGFVRTGRDATMAELWDFQKLVTMARNTQRGLKEPLRTVGDYTSLVFQNVEGRLNGGQ